MKVPAISIRVRTFLRTGSGEHLVSDRILRPLTAAERRQGRRDELRDYLETHGLPGAKHKGKRRYKPSARDMDSETVSQLNMALDQSGAPSKEDQEAIYKMMRSHLSLVAHDLAASGTISFSDVHDAEMQFFCVCRDSLAKWDPAKAGLKTFLYECVATAKLDFVKSIKREKRSFSHKHIPIENEATDCDAEAGRDDSLSGTVNAEALSDRHALERMEFMWAFHDFTALLDPDEKLALDYLLRDHTQEEVARWMGCTLMQFRRHILQSLQMKAVLCGFTPHNGTEICKG